MPRAARERVGGVRGGRLVVRVTAPPVDGKANAAACKAVAAALGVPKGAVSVARGASSRDKRLAVEGLDDATVRERLGL